MYTHRVRKVSNTTTSNCSVLTLSITTPFEMNTKDVRYLLDNVIELHMDKVCTDKMMAEYSECPLSCDILRYGKLGTVIDENAITGVKGSTLSNDGPEIVLYQGTILGTITDYVSGVSDIKEYTDLILFRTASNNNHDSYCHGICKNYHGWLFINIDTDEVYIISPV